jgi:AbrB family looped-hinge helix DNA binding protein
MKLTSKGQLTIPKKLRQKFGLGPRSEIEVVEDGDTLRIVKKGKGMSPVEKVYGLLKAPQSTDRLIEQIRGR